MNYAFDLNVYRNNLLRAAEVAIALMRDHSDELEPWLWHRLEMLNSEIRELDKSMIKYCKDIVV